MDKQKLFLILSNFVLLISLLVLFIDFDLFFYSSLIFIFIGSVVSFLLFFNKKENIKFLIILFLIAVSLRLIVFLFLNFFNIHIYLPDANFYLNSGLIKAQKGLFYGNKGGYNIFLGLLSILFKQPSIMASLINIFIGSLTPIIIFKIAIRTFNKKTAIFSSLLVALFPSIVLWSTQVLKDTFVIFLIALIILMASKLIEKNRLKKWLILFVSFSILATLRCYILFFLLLAVFVSYIFSKKYSLKKCVFYLVTFFIIFVLLFLFLNKVVPTCSFVKSQSVEEKENLPTQNHISKTSSLISVPFDYVDSIFNSMNRIRSNLAYGHTAFCKSVDISSPYKTLRFLPKGLTYFFLSPFSWQSLHRTNFNTSKTFILATILEMIFWYALLPFVFVGLYFSLKNLRKRSILIIFLLIATLFYALIEGNIGTLYRHRAQLLIFYFIFASYGLFFVSKFYKKKIK